MKVISGYFSGIIHFINGVILVLITGITRATTVGIGGGRGLHAQGRPPKCRHGILPLVQRGDESGWILWYDHAYIYNIPITIYIYVIIVIMAIYIIWYTYIHIWYIYDIYIYISYMYHIYNMYIIYIYIYISHIYIYISNISYIPVSVFCSLSADCFRILGVHTMAIESDDLPKSSKTTYEELIDKIPSGKLT